MSVALRAGRVQGRFPLVDRPRPGRGVRLLHAAIPSVGAAAWIGTQYFVFPELWSPSVALASLLPFAAIWFRLRNQPEAEYRVDGESVILRSGPARATFNLRDPQTVERLHRVPRVVRPGRAKNLANRYIDLVRVTTNDGRRYYISPSDPAEFTRLLQRAADRVASRPA